MHSTFINKVKLLFGLPLLVEGKIVFEKIPHSLANARVYVCLEETSFADAKAKVIQKQLIKNIPQKYSKKGVIPFVFYGEIPDKHGSYTISVLVDLDGDGKIGQGDYINMESYPVLTFGYPNRVIVLVKQVT